MIGRGEVPIGARGRDQVEPTKAGNDEHRPLPIHADPIHADPAQPGPRRRLVCAGGRRGNSRRAGVAATSPCSPDTTGLVTWNSAASSTATTGTLSTGGTVGVNAVANGGTRLDTSWTNLGRNNQISVVPAHTGALWLQLAQGGNNVLGQTLTFTFPQTVHCVSFYVQDIDTQWVSSPVTTYNDTITVPGFTAALTGSNSNTTVSGGQAHATVTATSGTANTYSWDYRTNDNGLVLFTASGPITWFTMSYTNPDARNATSVNSNNMQAWVSPISYSTVACAC